MLPKKAMKLGSFCKYMYMLLVQSSCTIKWFADSTNILLVIQFTRILLTPC